jgi:hypothetical protein
VDDLVAKYGQGLKPNQLIKIDGKIMAIAVAVNLQHTSLPQGHSRSAWNKGAGDVRRASCCRQEDQGRGLVEHPLGATYKADWNIGIDFNNLFAGTVASM